MDRPVLRRERVYLVLVAAVSAAVYALLVLSIVGVAIAAAVALLVVFVRFAALGHLRGNGVLATTEQFPELRRIADDVAAEMGMQRTPQVWVYQAARVLGSLTRRYVQRHHVVLSNELAELAWEGEEQRRALRFLLAHEFARVQRQLPVWGALLLPGRYFPFLGKAWSRAANLTFDRMAARVAGEGYAPALAVYAAGPEMFTRVQDSSHAGQARARGFWAWAFEVLSRARPLARRANHLAGYVGTNHTMPGESPRRFTAPSNRSLDRITAAVLLGAGPTLAVIALMSGGTQFYDALTESVRPAASDFRDGFLVGAGLDEGAGPDTDYDLEDGCDPGYYDGDDGYCYPI